jgi:hypothetical protein
VEGAKAPQLLVPLGQAQMLADDLDEVELGLDLGEGVVGWELGHCWSVLSDDHEI